MTKDEYSTPPPNRLYGIIYFAACILAILFLVIGLHACTTAKKAVGYFDKHVPLSAEYCSSKYPPKDSVSQIILYKESEPIISHDTSVVSKTDTLNNVVTKTVYITKTVLIHDTVTNTKVTYQSDKAKETQLTGQLADKTKVADTYATSSKKWELRAVNEGISLLLIAIAGIIYAILKIKGKIA